jgi:HPt (histidine-containing phosphotransfer) domain-containing protein
MEENSLPIDIVNELKEFANDVEFFKGLLDDFFWQAEKRISILEDAVINKNYQVMKAEVHAIKGGAANLGANTLSKAALDLEDIIKTDTFDKSSEGVGKIKNEFLRLKVYIQNLDSLKL